MDDDENFLQWGWNAGHAIPPIAKCQVGTLANNRNSAPASRLFVILEHLDMRYFSIAIIYFVLGVDSLLGSRLADDRAGRVQAGQRFLSKSRIDKWERYFSEGLPKFGKIVTLLDGAVVKEAWFEEDFMLIKDYHPERTYWIFSNPDYSAMLESHKEQYKLLSADVSESKTELVYSDAIPFAFCSSVNLTRESIPRFLQQEKLKISDYRLEEGRHIVELAFVDESDRNSIVLVFLENNPSMLPDEVIFNKETAGRRRFTNTEFVDIEGYHIPLTLNEEGSAETATVELYPQERLNREMCRLRYFGIPEPNRASVTDFGREGSSWRWIVFGLLCLIAGVSCFWTRTRSFRRKKW